MISSLIYKLKQSKVLFTLAIALLVVAVFDVAVIIFNVVELIVTNINPAKLVSGFLTFNIIAAIVNALAVICVILYILFRKR